MRTLITLLIVLTLATVIAIWWNSFMDKVVIDAQKTKSQDILRP